MRTPKGRAGLYEIFHVGKCAYTVERGDFACQFRNLSEAWAFASRCHAMPDTIWTYDAHGRRLHGRPNYDKPGVAERVSREAFADYCFTHPVSVVEHMRRVNDFEEKAERAP